MLELFKKYELEFLGSFVRSWGWQGKDAQIFVQRMLRDNLDLSNGALAEVLEPPRRSSSSKPAFTSQAIADTFGKENKVYDRLLPLGLQVRDWKMARCFLEEEQFPLWLKQKLWQELWAKAEPHRFGLVVPQMEHSGFSGDAKMIIEEENALQQFVQGEAVMLEIPAGVTGHLLLLEQDDQGQVLLVAPSALMQDAVLRGDRCLLPQFPPFPRPVVQLSTVGRSDLWAGILPAMPDWDWLDEGRSTVLALSEIQVARMLAHVAGLPQGDRQLWKTSYEVVAA